MFDQNNAAASMQQDQKMFKQTSITRYQFIINGFTVSFTHMTKMCDKPLHFIIIKNNFIENS